MGPVCASLKVDWGAPSHGVVKGVLIEGFVLDDVISSEAGDEPRSGPTTELGVDGTDNNIV